MFPKDTCPGTLAALLRGEHVAGTRTCADPKWRAVRDEGPCVLLLSPWVGREPLGLSVPDALAVHGFW